MLEGRGMARELTLIDAGLGNLASVERALLQVGAAPTITSDPEEILNSRMLVFPGQGAFSERTEQLVDGTVGEAIRAVIQRGDPFLGICLGMQLLFSGSDEFPEARGLGLLQGHCRRFPEDMLEAGTNSNRRLKIPHMGWNNVEPTGKHYYFVHSYYVDGTDPADVLWTADYGSIKFPAAIRHQNIYGCQFHPEKSQTDGLRFLRAFLLGSGQ